MFFLPEGVLNSCYVLKGCGVVQMRVLTFYYSINPGFNSLSLHYFLLVLLSPFRGFWFFSLRHTFLVSTIQNLTNSNMTINPPNLHT